VELCDWSQGALVEEARTRQFYPKAGSTQKGGGGMEEGRAGSPAARLMIQFAETTGLDPEVGTPRRYLWTDAFAVCNYLELFRRTGDASWRELALRLVERVHHTLGRHRPDDPRAGWISGLDDKEGERRPTAGGLRIGKELPERSPGDPFDERLEWERDGQYYHYLTKWMHALSRTGSITGEAAYLRWAVELAKTAHSRFTSRPRHGGGRMYWKMSIDLSRPLVASMGQHDPLDGLVTCCELQAAAESAGMSGPIADLHEEISGMAELCRGIDLETSDPLGIGGLLFDACGIVQLTLRGKFSHEDLLERVMEASLAGLGYLAEEGILRLPARYRLPFRELGLSIGLHGAEKMRGWIGEHPACFSPEVRRRLEGLSEHIRLGGAIERFWLDPANREAATWSEHREINGVMLATSLAPDGFLAV
jgi:hypothetical protein